MDRKRLGALGEKLAGDFLKKKGYRLLVRNYRCREGEMDIIARHKGCLVFVEVRTKSGGEYGTPEESITRAKRDKLVTVALAYLRAHPGKGQDWRIDMVA
ncbi:MAG: YraN family protein, partial [Chloroflexi bacterium]|nr:YraN family protein [Chloroflexota bacterium]